MSSSNPEDIKKEVRVYMLVFGALLFFTIVTVAVSYLHLNFFWAVTVALIIATIKVSLVGGYFMHLVSERVIVYALLIFTAVCFVGLLLLPVIEHHDPIYETKYHGHFISTRPEAPAQEHHNGH